MNIQTNQNPRERERERVNNTPKFFNLSKLSKKLFAVFMATAFILSSSPIFAATKSWDFTTSGDYTYDDTKIEITSSQAQLKATGSPDWYNASWIKRKPITIDNTGNASTLTDYQVQVDVTYDSDMLANFDDIRFTDDGTTLLDYYLDSETDSTSAVFWVKVPSIAGSSTKTIYMYYGNSGVSSASDGASTFEFFNDFPGSSLGPTSHAAVPLTTPTYDGSGQVVHPSVIKFDTAWHGYIYWMAITPYPAGNAAYENPSILASNDGETWVVPDGLTNPVVPAPGGGWINDDPELFYDTDSDQLWLYYDESIASPSEQKMFRRTSADGVTWSDASAALIDVTPASSFVSPSVAKIGDTYYLWNVNAPGGWSTSSTIEMRTSADGVTWSAPSTGTISPTPYSAQTYPWHISVRYIPSKSQFWAIYNTDSTSGDLYLAKSTDGLTWTAAKLMEHSASGWDTGLYRTSFIYDSDTNIIKIWYTGTTGASGEWHIGYTEYEGDADNFLNNNVGPESGTWSLEGGTLKGTVPTATPITIRTIPTFSDCVIHFKVKLNTSGYAYAFYRNTSGTNRYFFNIRDSDNVMRLYKDASTQLAQWAVTVDQSTWYDVHIYAAIGVNDVYIDGTKRLSSSDSTHIGASPVSLGGYQGTQYFDDFWIAQYNSSPPSVSVGSEENIYDSSTPTIYPNSAQNFTTLSAFIETAVKNGGQIKYQVSNDNGTTWYWYNTSWTATTAGYTEANTATDINTNISTLPTNTGSFLFKAYLNSDGSQLVQLDNIDLTYTNTRTLTYTAGAHGTISGTSPQTVNYGSDGSAVTAVADSGYEFSSWSDSSTQNPRTDTNVTANVSVTASFQAVASTTTAGGGAPPSLFFDISVSPGPNGKISPSWGLMFYSGTSQTFNITPNSGYQIADVLVDGVSIGAQPSYTFSSINNQHSISATFSKIGTEEQTGTTQQTTQTEQSTEEQTSTTQEQTQSKIQELIAKINELKNQISQMQNLPSAVFASPLYRGMQSDDVQKLQTLLATKPEIYPEAIITGYFGPLTEKAIQRFQLQYQVVSTESDPGFGYVGPKTREKLKEVFGG